jgi:hypothetical protein
LPTQPTSLYFITFHKCASTLVQRELLPAFFGLEVVDFAAQASLGQEDQDLVFADCGHLYGPIRLTANQDSPTRKFLLDRVANLDFLQDKRVMFFIRDPRDILVSMYFSFGWSHPLSKNERVRAIQVAQRQEIQKMDLDTYVLREMPALKRACWQLAKLRMHCQDSDLVRYEDCAARSPAVEKLLRQKFQLSPSVVHNFFDQLQPRAEEDPRSHHRSGRVASYAEKLKSETNDILRHELGDLLWLFGYETQA